MAVATHERVLAVLEAAFLPLETHTSLEEDRVQVRVMDGSEAIHIEEKPLAGLQDEAGMRNWIEKIRKRLGGLGYDLDNWKMPEGGSGAV